MTGTALFIVDVQNDFIEGGSLAVQGGYNVAREITEHVKETPYDHIITSQDWHINPGTHWSETPNYVTTWPIHCEAGTLGAEIHPDLAGELADRDNVISIHKGEYEDAYSGFEGYIVGNRDTPVADYLRAQGITDLVVCGLATDHCVQATVRDALDNGFNVTVVPDLSAGVDATRSAEALEALALIGAVVR